MNFSREWCCLRDDLEDMGAPHRPQMTIWRRRVACWVT